jgi:hypothetical protein
MYFANTREVISLTLLQEIILGCHYFVPVKRSGVTYFASRASANTPAASGAAALVPEWVVVHFPYRSVVACRRSKFDWRQCWYT